MSTNAMDLIDTEIKNEWPNWNDYPMKDYFTKIATILPDRNNEKIVPQKGYDSRYHTLPGACYAFVIDGKFVKQGKTDTTLEKRIQSYNCGKKAARRKGTCSTSNYKCLQSILAINKPVDLMVCYIPPIYMDAFGEKVAITESPAKYIERKLNKIAENTFGKLPWCVQR